MKFEMSSSKAIKPIQRSQKADDSPLPRSNSNPINGSATSNKINSTLQRSPASVSPSARQSDRGTFSDRPTLADMSTRSTFTPDHDRYSHADVLLRRTVTAALKIIPDSDEEWTKSLIIHFNKTEEASVSHGAMPKLAAFARELNFWKAFALAGVLGAILGLCTLGFMNFTDKIPKMWANMGPTTQDDDFFICGSCNPQDDGCKCTKYDNCQWYKGNKLWIVVTASTGFLVGLLRFLFEYPDNLPGLFVEINSYRVDPNWAPYTILISAISLAGGASLGPEQGLGNLGGGLATFITEKYLKFEDDDYRKLTVLGGMASALGALFPSPLLGVLMFQELGNPPRTHMESTLILSAGACISFLVYYAIVNVTFTSSITSNGGILAINWEFEEWNCLVAVVIGFTSAALAFVLILFIGITKQIFNRIRLRLERFPFLAKTIPPTLAGIAIGTVNWALPLTIGNGNMTISPLIDYGYQNLLSTNLLVCTAFSRMFLLAISMNSGFIGGFIFPILTIGVTAGVAGNQMYPGCPLGLMVGCFMASLPSAICPMPLTLCGITIYSFFFGLYQTSPIFIASIVSYTLIVGSGLFEGLQNLVPKNEEKEQQESEQATDMEEKGSTEQEKNAINSAKELGEAIDKAKQVYVDQLKKQDETLQTTTSPLQKYYD